MNKIMTRELTLKINQISSSIITLQNKIRVLEEDINKDIDYIHYNAEISSFGYYGDSLGFDEMTEIMTRMKSQEITQNDNIRVRIEHTTENTDPWEDCESDVTNVTIYADVSFSEKEIEDAKNIKLAKIEELKVDMKKLEDELVEMMKDEN